MDISARVASHFIKAANHYENSDFSIPQIVSITFYLKLACMAQILHLYFKNKILITCYSLKVSKGIENKFKIKICTMISNGPTA